MTAIDELMRPPEALERTPDVEPRPRKLRVIRNRLTLVAVALAAGAWSRRKSLPGYAGALAVSAGIAGVIDFALPGIGWWVFSLCAGLFLLAVDYRMP